MYNDLINWLEKNQGTCLYKKHLGISCPGCGIQSAFIELLKGNVFESIILYPALIPVILFALFAFFNIFIKIKNSYSIYRFLIILIIILIFGNYILKLIL